MKDLKYWLSLVDRFGPVKAFIVTIGFVISAAIISIYIGIYINYRDMALHSIREEAYSYYNTIIQAREWNAIHSGVYVRKEPGVKPNQYLRKLGIEPDIKTADGQVLTLQNPSLVDDDKPGRPEGITFHLTSLRLVNPDNAPDEFEAAALASFEEGLEQAWEIDGEGEGAVFRLMKPLIIRQDCLNCHKGYKPGDIRGGICINVPYDMVDEGLKATKNKIALMSVITMSLIMGALYITSSRMLRQLHEMQNRLFEASITDDLTGIYNRRFVIGRLSEEFSKSARTGSPLSVIIFDIDHFKRVNDTYGHLLGDLVLKEVAKRAKSSLRAYDILGRFGGEEFLVVAPDTPVDDAVNLARRLNVLIKNKAMGDEDNAVNITASFGVASTTVRDESYNALLGRADKALYRAKELGRDRVTY